MEKLLGFFLVGLLIASSSCDKNESVCPTWLHHSNDGQCVCGSRLGDVIECNDETGNISILSTYCLTSSDTDPAEAVAGSCLFQESRSERDLKSQYINVNKNLSLQNQILCDSYFNRQGQLCSQCTPNHYVSAYAYDLICHPCKHSLVANAILYLTVAFLPLTLFLIVVLFLHVSIASPALHLAVLLSQMYSSSEMTRKLIQTSHRTPGVYTLLAIAASLNGIWNLDFLRALIPPICLRLSTLQVIALDYLVAVYPLLLLICFYMLVKAHDRGYRVVMWLWGPFHWCSSRIRHQYDIKHSIIDAFATFIILTYLKIFSVSADLVLPTAIYSSDGSLVGHYVYYSASIAFMSSEHMPYVLLAMVGLLWGILFPIMLLLYPMMWFQKFLRKIHLNGQGLRNLMQCFHGYYHDGTDGGWDCKYYSALYPTLRIVAYLIYTTTRNFTAIVFLPIIISMVAVVIIAVNPYKELYTMYNKVDVILLMSCIGFCASSSLYKFSLNWYQIPLGFSLTMVFLCGMVPSVYLILLVLKGLRKSFCKNVCSRSCYHMKNNESEFRPLLDRVD